MAEQKLVQMQEMRNYIRYGNTHPILGYIPKPPHLNTQTLGTYLCINVVM